MFEFFMYCTADRRRPATDLCHTVVHAHVVALEDVVQLRYYLVAPGVA